MMLVIGIYYIFFQEELFLGHVWVFFGLFQGGWGLYKKQNHYLTIENGKLTQHSFLPKSIDINNIKIIRKFVNSYKIETSDKTIKIDKHVIDNEALYELTGYLNNLRLKI